MNKILYRKTLLLFVLAFAIGALDGFCQEYEVQGVVVSMRDGKPLKNITVKILDNASDPELSDSTGAFSITVPHEHVILEFSYPGIKTSSSFLDGRSFVKIGLVEEDDYWFEDQISVPLGITSNKNFNGAKSYINKRGLEQSYSSSFETRMMGQAAGVNVVEYSGAPGSGSSVAIRGLSSINGGTQPLYVVDGLILKNYQFDNPLAPGANHNPLADISPEDIKSLTILKDGASASFYGVRGANGVVLIETNKGTSGKTKLSFNAYWGLAQMAGTQRVLNKEQFKTYYKDLRYQDGMTVSEFADAFGNYFYEDSNGEDFYRFSNNTNWQDEVSQLGNIQNYHLNLQGGDQYTNYAFSTAYYNQKGVVTGTDYSRFSIDFNLVYQITPKLRFGNVVNFSFAQKNLMDEGINPYSNPLFTSLIKAPMLAPSIYSASGLKLGTHEDQDFFNISNPSHITSHLKNESGINRFLGNLYLDIDINKDISSKISLAVDYNRQSEKRFYPDYGLVSMSNAQRYSEGKTHNRFLIQSGGIIEYAKVIDHIHKLNATAGVEYSTQKLDYTYGRSINSAADYFTTLSKGKADSIASDDMASVLGSAYANVDYTLKDRYSFHANVRMDASSRFGMNSRYGTFYGSSAAWRISSEPFLRDVKFINELKLKAGFGKSGNENIDDFAAYNLYAGSAYNLRGATKPISLGNADLKWETTNQYDFGIEFLGLNARLGLDVDFYLKKTSDLFYVKELPSITGYSGVLSNLGDVENLGFDLSLFGRIVDRKLVWDTRLNLGAYRNTVTRLPAGDFAMNYRQFTGLAREGQPLGVFLGYEADGIYDSEEEISLSNGPGYDPFQPGDLKYRDVVEDGIINDQDMTVIGDPNPDFFGGVINTLRFKNITFDLNLMFSYGNEVINTTRSVLESMSFDYNQTTAVLRAWQNTGDASHTNVPRISYGDPTGNARNSSRWVEDASFLRIQSATISYDFSQKLVDKTLFKSVNIYLKGQNLYTISNYLGYNPDIRTGYNPLLFGIDMGAYPVPRTFFLGVKIGL